jgi:hypothetical protein
VRSLAARAAGLPIGEQRECKRASVQGLKPVSLAFPSLVPGPSLAVVADLRAESNRTRRSIVVGRALRR